MFETSASIYPLTRRNIPENLNTALLDYSTMQTFAVRHPTVVSASVFSTSVASEALSSCSLLGTPLTGAEPVVFQSVTVARRQEPGYYILLLK